MVRLKSPALRKATSALTALVVAGAGLMVIAPSNAAPLTTFINDCGDLAQKPSDVVLRCADGYSMVTDVKWSSWKKSRATGRGTFEQGAKSYPARITLNAPKTQSGQRVFTRMVVSFIGKGPKGKKSQIFKITPYAVGTAVAPEPAPSASPEVAPSASPSASATPSASASPSVSPSASPSPSPSLSAIAPLPVPGLELESIRYSSTAGLIVTSKASFPGNFASKRGIKSVTVYRPNEYNAEIAYKANYIGEETTDRDEWSAVLPCDRSAKMKDTLRIEAVSDIGTKTSIRVPQTVTSC